MLTTISQVILSTIWFYYLLFLLPWRKVELLHGTLKLVKRFKKVIISSMSRPIRTLSLMFIKKLLVMLPRCWLRKAKWSLLTLLSLLLLRMKLILLLLPILLLLAVLNKPRKLLRRKHPNLLQLNLHLLPLQVHHILSIIQFFYLLFLLQWLKVELLLSTLRLVIRLMKVITFSMSKLIRMLSLICIRKDLVLLLRF